MSDNQNVLNECAPGGSIEENAQVEDEGDKQSSQDSRPSRPKTPKTPNASYEAASSEDLNEEREHTLHQPTRTNQAESKPTKEPSSEEYVPEGFTGERMLSVGKGKGSHGKGGKGKGKGGRQGKGGDNCPVRKVYADTNAVFFYKDGKAARDAYKHMYFLTQLPIVGEPVGVISTVQNTCPDFATTLGCQRGKCNKYHEALGMVMDALPCAPGRPPAVYGEVPHAIRNHRALSHGGVNLFEWSREVKTRNDAADEDAHKKVQEELSTLNLKRQRMQEAVTALHFAKAARTESQRYRGQVDLGLENPYLHTPTGNNMLGYTPQLQLGMAPPMEPMWTSTQSQRNSRPTPDYQQAAGPSQRYAPQRAAGPSQRYAPGYQQQSAPSYHQQRAPSQQLQETNSDDEASDWESFERYKVKRAAHKAAKVKEEQRKSASRRASRARSDERDPPHQVFAERNIRSELINTGERRNSAERGNSNERNK